MGVSCLYQVPLCFVLEAVPDWPGESPAWSPMIDNLLCAHFWSEPHYDFSMLEGVIELIISFGEFGDLPSLPTWCWCCHLVLVGS